MDVVILAGGGGTRLHPLSTPERPKPFLPLLAPGPGRVPETLLQRTVRRLLAEPDPVVGSPSAITVVVATAYADLVREQVPEVGILEEPVGRNTAPAIALAALAPTPDRDRPDDRPARPLTRPEDADPVIAILPADHLIADEAGFRSVLAAAGAELAGGAFGISSPLVTLGIRPDRPAVEYGYLVPDPERAQGPAAGTDHRLDARPLHRFEEKPTIERAAALLADPGVAWNAGMFLWRRSAIVAALERFAPDIAGPIRDGLASGDLGRAYGEVRPISIDYAVMEPAAAAGLVVTAAMDVGWSDLGGWGALLEALGARGSGRVVRPGETATVAADDLVVRRVDGRLVLETGAREGILDPDGPTALLTGARADQAIVRALVARCSPTEVSA